MTEPPLVTEHRRFRTTALWSTEWARGTDDHDAGTGPAVSREATARLYSDAAEPLASHFDRTGYQRWYRDGADQLPRVLHVQQHRADELVLERSGAAVEVLDLWSWLFIVPSGAIIAGLTLDYDTHDPLPSPAELYRDLDANREALTLGSVPLLTACCPPVVVDVGALRFGGDFHGITMLPETDGLNGPDSDLHLLQVLVSRATDPSRAAHLTVRTPPEPNRYHHMAAGVTPGATVLAGHIPAIEGSMVVCAIQALTALATLRELRRTAFAALAALRRPDRPDHAWVAARRRELRALEVDLSFGVEAHLDIRLLIPSLPVEELHAAVTGALSLSAGARTAGSMIRRLQAAIDAEAQAHQEHEAVVARARRGAAAAAATTAAIVALPLTFLGASASQVSATRSMWDIPHYWPYYLGLVVLVLITAATAWGYVRFVERGRAL